MKSYWYDKLILIWLSVVERKENNTVKSPTETKSKLKHCASETNDQGIAFA